MSEARIVGERKRHVSSDLESTARFLTVLDETHNLDVEDGNVGRIFEVEVVSVVVRGEALTDLEPNSIYGLRLAPSDKDTHPKASLGYMTVRSDQALSIYMDQIRCGDDEPVEAVIRYTDERGYRWEVGTSGEARRVRASEA